MVLFMKSYKIDSVDYSKVGLLCGLELHQQLNTNKLFCKCPSKLINDSRTPDFVIKRKLRPVSSESGELDETAKIEKIKNKTFIYHGYNKCNCLVETDSQPPFPINKEALEISMIISLLTNSSFVSKGYTMRKQVINGSNVSGFQRTTMISTDGFLDFNFGRVRIDKILLEEDAARPIEKKDDEIIYSLDRLGVPLIEMVVWHDMHTPESVKEVASYVGQLFRSTGKTKRGLGSIRQDINISIKDGARVEIKGCQELDIIPEVIKREVVRQLNLLEVRKELRQRNISKISLDFKNISNIFKDSNSKIILKAISEGKDIFSFKLENFKGILGFEVQENRRIGTELASILKSSTSLKGVFHSDELPNYGITDVDVENICSSLSLKENDAFLIVMCHEKELLLVKDLLEKRINYFSIGVPKETRMTTIDGNTEYQRPLSSASRMYPETDLEPIAFTSDLISSVSKKIPLSIDKRKEMYVSDFKISSQLAEKMKINNFAPIFEKIILNTSVNPTNLAVFLLEDLVKASRDSLIDLDDISDKLLFDLFSSENIFEVVSKNKVMDVFIKYLENPYDLKKIISDNKKEDVDVSFLEKIIENIISENKDFVVKQKERSIGFIMGKTMEQTENKFDGKIISQLAKSKIIDFLKENKSF